MKRYLAYRSTAALIRIWRRTAATFGLLVWFASVPVPGGTLDFSFELIPTGGVIQGAAGSSIGWGYTITNLDPVNWLLPSSLEHDLFSLAIPDASLFDFPILGPGQSASLAFDPDNLAGLFQITWDPGAPPGFVNAGIFTVTAEFYDGDPFSGGALVGSQQRFAEYTASVSTQAPIPEPSTIGLMVSGLLALSAVRRKSRQAGKPGSPAPDQKDDLHLRRRRT